MSRHDQREVVVAGHLGNASVALAGLDNTDPAVRRAALGALERMDALTATHVGEALTDPDPGVRRRGAEVAPSLERSDPGGAPGVDLRSILADDDNTVVEMAAWAIGERPADPATVDAVVEVARNHHDALCREAAVAALGSLGDRSGLAAILEAMGDIATVRRRAVLALAPFQGDAVEAALTTALSDRDWQVRQGAEDLLDI